MNYSEILIFLGVDTPLLSDATASSNPAHKLLHWFTHKTKLKFLKISVLEISENLMTVME